GIGVPAASAAYCRGSTTATGSETPWSVVPVVTEIVAACRTPGTPVIRRRAPAVRPGPVGGAETTPSPPTPCHHPATPPPPTPPRARARGAYAAGAARGEGGARARRAGPRPRPARRDPDTQAAPPPPPRQFRQPAHDGRVGADHDQRDRDRREHGRQAGEQVHA